MTPLTRPENDQLIKKALLEIRDLKAKLSHYEAAEHEPIAVIGMSCRFPGARNPEEFWQLLLKGSDAVGEIPADRGNMNTFYDSNPNAPGKMYTNAGAFLEDFDHFSPAFFGISPREAQFMDPQQRLILEVSWQALEDAGIAPERLAEKQVGMYVGIGSTDYSDYCVGLGPTAIDAYNGTGGSHSVSAGRLSYLLGVRGPSLAVDTACSSSLVSVHLAINSLRNKESAVAIATGVSINFSPDVFVSLCKAHMLSPDGRCKAFDARANGYVRGEGCGTVILKRLSDALADGDHIHALIAGNAVNHNGRSSGLTVPSGPAQQEVIRTALKVAGLKPDDINYVEAHGTGTAVGDPIEAGALGAVFGDRDRALLMGSVKTNVGHLEWAAGVCGLIKTILSIKHGVIPPSLHFEEPNPLINWGSMPLRVVTETTAWPAGPRNAGVSSFGFGGTNAHVIVTEPPLDKRQGAAPDAGEQGGERPMHAFVLSARTKTALCQLAGRMAEALEKISAEQFADFCYSANTGRSHFEFRLATAAADPHQLRQVLEQVAQGQEPDGAVIKEVPTARPKTAMLFTGQGAQYTGMARVLYDTQPTFRQTMNECNDLLLEVLDKPLLDVLYPGPQASESERQLINDTAYTQPALFALEYSMATLLRSWGVEPDVLLGHSVGELAAACFAGVFSLQDGLRLVAARAKLMQALPKDGAMVAIRTSEAAVAPAVAAAGGLASIAAVNSPTDVVISGETAAVEAVAAQFAQEGVTTQKLTVSHAFHSHLMEPMLAAFAEVAGGVTFHTPQIALISNLTGKPAGAEITEPNYWVDHVRQAVRFADGIKAAQQAGCTTFVEVGPTPTLTGLGKLTLSEPADARANLWLPALHPRRGDWQQLISSLGELHCAAGEINWAAFDHDYTRKKLPLPTYPFERQRYWFPHQNLHGSKTTALRPLVESLTRSPLVKETILATTFSTVSHAWLADHKIFGEVVMPGAGYLAMMVSGAEVMGIERCRLEEVYFVAPMAIEAGKKLTVQAVLSPEGTGSSFNIVSLGEADMTSHATGKLSATEAEALQPIDAKAIQERCRKASEAGKSSAISPDELFASITEAGTEPGPCFRWVDQIWVGEGEALAHLSQPEAIQTDGYKIHPALMDTCFQVIVATLEGDASADAHLPFALKSMVFNQAAAGREFWCHAQRIADLKWNITLADSQGAVIAQIEHFELRKVPRDLLVRRQMSDWLYRQEWLKLPLAVAEQGSKQNPSTVSQKSTWVILGKKDGLGGRLKEALAQQGHSLLITEVQDSEGFADIFKVGAADGWPKLAGVIHAWGPDVKHESTANSSSEADVPSKVERNLFSLLELTKGLLSIDHSGARLIVLTRGSQAVRSGEQLAVEQSPLWGMGKSLQLEAPQLGLTCIDLSPEPTEANSALETESLLREILTAGQDEGLVALRGNERFVARLNRYRDAVKVGASGPFRLQLKEYGSPDNLVIAPIERRAPGPLEIEIEIKAASLIFRDVLISLGMLQEHYKRVLNFTRAADVPLGFDCAGIVVRVGEGVTRFKVGDEVMAQPQGSLASHLTTFEGVVTRKPARLDFNQAAACPAAFWTAYHALHTLTKLKPGERVLIHAAAGGVGLAAVQMAQRAGAEIFATASPGKWEYLQSIGIKHIMHSRNVDFAEEIMSLTGGEGVDVVLNCLTGEALEKSFAVLKQGGRFIEFGKLGIWTAAEARERRPDASYHFFDLGDLAARDPDAFAAVFDRVSDMLQAGELEPLPQTVFAFEDAVDAFRYMQQARHIGKVVLTVGSTADAAVRTDSSYIVTGGLGALGLKVAEQLARQGAKHLVLVGRSKPSAEAQATIKQLIASGTAVQVVQADLAQTQDVADLVALARSQAPLAGVVHAAGVLQDAIVQNQSPESFAKVLAPKVKGAWALHNETLSDALDFFVCFSSMSSLMGAPGQTNYAAANAFLDALMRQRRTRGLPGLSINWGPWAEIGMAANLNDAAHGLDKIDVEAGLSTFSALLPQSGRPGPVAVGVMRVRWQKFAPSDAPSFLANMVQEKNASAQAAGSATQKSDEIVRRFFATEEEGRGAFAEAYIHEQLLRVLGLEGRQDIRTTLPWRDLGLDSLMTVELKSRLEKALGLAIPMELFIREVSSRTLAEYVTAKLIEKGAAPEAQATAERTAAGNTDAPQPLSSASLSVDDSGRLELMEKVGQIPQAYTVADDQKGRRVLIDQKWRIDFASCNYLGLDLEAEMNSAITEAVDKWGVHPSWTRAVASPRPYDELERKLADLVGAPETLVFPSISLLHQGVLPALAGFDGIIFKDQAAHHSIHEACLRAQADGAEWVEFRHNDLEDLAQKLSRYRLDRPRIIATDGAFSMGGENPPLAEYAKLAKIYGGWVYVDDAHGFGIFGENPDDNSPYGYRGNGIVRHMGLDYASDRIIYVAGLSKAFSSYAAFVTVPDQLTKIKLRSSGPYVFSGPTSVASLATALTGLAINERDGDRKREHILKLTQKLIKGARGLGFEVDNDGLFPIVGIVAGDLDIMVKACQELWKHDILITPATYPAVPLDRNLMRFSITAANTEDEIDLALAALEAVRRELGEVVLRGVAAQIQASSKRGAKTR